MQIPIPPPPMPLTSLLASAAGVGVFVGSVLMLWGRSVGRVLLALVVAAAGALSAPHLSRFLNVRAAWAITLGAAAIAGVIGFLLARVLWAVLLGGFCAAAGLAVLCILSAPGIAEKPEWIAAEGADLATWCREGCDYAWRWTGALWQHNRTGVVACTGVPVVIAGVLVIFWPKGLVILASSVLGAAGAVFGTGLGVWAFQPAWAAGWIQRYYIPPAAAGVLALTGLIVQIRSHVLEASRRREAKAEAAEPQPIGPPGKATEKNAQ